jgi:hypothetical protein
LLTAVIGVQLLLALGIDRVRKASGVAPLDRAKPNA